MKPTALQRPRVLSCIFLAFLTAAQDKALAETLTADADADVILNGDNDNDSDPTVANQLGRAVSSAGDFNGDGRDDVIVTDYADTGSFAGRGTAYIYYGGRTGTFDEPDTNADVVLRVPGLAFRNSVSSAGDFNGDGYDDVIVGAIGGVDGSDPGAAYVFFGRETTAQQILEADSDADVVIRGQDSVVGRSVASAGDFDGDGLGDVIVGGAYPGSNDTVVYIVFGRGSESHQILIAETDAALTLTAQTPAYGFGDALASAGDFNGDGLDDVIVGAFGGNGFLGSAYIFFGGRTGTIDDPDANADVALYGEGSLLGFGQFGHAVASAGDYNGDGFDDVIVGDDFHHFGAEDENGLGAAFVFFGGQTGTLHESDADLTVTAPGVGLPASEGMTDLLGSSVASAGDYDGDGLADVIIGSPGIECEDCIPTNGSAYIYFGPRIGVFDDPESSADVVLHGQSLSDYFGVSVASAGDFDGDGLDDVLLGAPGDNNVAEYFSGAAFVFFGRGSESDSVPPVVSDVVATPNPVAVGSDSILTAMVSDEAGGGSPIESASYTVDGGQALPMDAADGSFDETAEDLTAILDFDQAGIFEVCVTASDAAGNVSGPLCILVTVYSPGAGFVTGGGFIQSTDGACTLTPDCAAVTGKANFGFVSKYHGDAVTPSGSTEFNFPSGGLNFHSSSYEWLVITGAHAQFKGAGTINGGGDYGFLLTVIDGTLAPGTADDLFRIKIWDRNAGDAIVYDNEIGLGDGADPSTPTSGGQIVIH